MTDEIKVYVIDKGRTNLYLRYIDPLTGKPVEKRQDKQPQVGNEGRRQVGG